MATMKYAKKTGAARSLAKLAKGAAVTDFTLQDNGDGSYSVTGIDAAENPVDISAVATISVGPAADATLLTVDPAVGMTFKLHAIGPLGTTTVPLVATWTDGSIGPFSFTMNLSIVAGPATGVAVNVGSITSH